MSQIRKLLFQSALLIGLIFLLFVLFQMINWNRIIIDEFHNLSKNNIIDEEDDFYKVLNSDHKIMFMSATPRVYELEDEMTDTEHIFGEIFYKKRRAVRYQSPHLPLFYQST